MISGAPWYVSNETLHEDLKIPQIQDIISLTYINTKTEHQCMKIVLSRRPIHPNLRRKKTEENLARRHS
jgi:hypothetical protein